MSLVLISVGTLILSVQAEEINPESNCCAVQPFDPVLSANRALHGFVTHAPRCLPGPEGYYRACFWCKMLPETFLSPDPKAVDANRWDMGDCTGRAMLAWSALREMTGDKKTGYEVEQGQKNFLLSILHPETGLVYVSDLSDKKDNKYEYHIWDISRTARGLVSWYNSVPEDRQKLKPYLERFWAGIEAKATVRGTDEAWGLYAGWPTDSFTTDQPGKTFYGHFVNNRVGICIEPLVDYFLLTGEQKYLDMAIRYTNGEFGGHQGDHGQDEHKKYFAFNPDGSFEGHMHTKLGFFIGVVKLSRYLAEHGQLDQAKSYLRKVHTCYEWIFDEKNPTPSSKTGWVVESPHRETGETCCTADMIQLIGQMARCASLDPEFHDWANLYDEVESMLVNAIAHMQIHFTEPFEKFLLAHYQSDAEKQLELAHRLDGSWSVMEFPNERTTHPRGQTIIMIGCCQYAGVRGLYNGWRDAMEYTDGKLLINFLLNRQSPQATMNTSVPLRGEGEIFLKDKADVFIRMPSWLTPEQMKIKIDGTNYPTKDHLDRTSHYISLGHLDQGAKICITYPLSERITKEKLSNIEYTIHWRGNYVVKMNPPGEFLSIYPTE